MNCKYCESTCKKSGRQKRTGRQKYQCMNCKKYQQCTYIYKAYEKETDQQIIKHVKRSNGIRDISYLLNISPVTVIARIRKIANGLETMFHERSGRSYEMDELYTFA